MNDHGLHPDSTLHKILISSTSKIVGEFTSENLLITHAWQNFTSPSNVIRHYESPVSRSGFIVAFKTEPQPKKAGTVLHDYTHVGEVICSYLSVLFGKRFDIHGLIEGNGFYQIPDLSSYNSICNPNLKINSHKERACFRIPLNLSNFKPFNKIFINSDINPKEQTKLNTACKFYRLALSNAENEPEIAYLHLITSGEILTSFFKYEQNELLDDSMLDNLSRIKSEINNGDKIVRQISNRLLGIKKKFVKSLCSLVDNNFFSEVESEMGNFSPNEIEKSIGAAYDLRSKYVHTGIPFANWVMPRSPQSDLQLGQPVLDSKEYSKLLFKAPTFSGLERLIRYCLLNFMSENDYSNITSVREFKNNEKF